MASGIKAIFLVLVLNLVGYAGVAAAEDLSFVLVNVRAIRASNPVNRTAAEQTIDARLSDIQSKLKSFEYSRFRMISNQKLQVPLKKRESVNLTEKTTLHVRPLYLEEGRVGMWIKWIDSNSDDVLLDTRMHFNAQESMVTGTNCKNDKALILAISAEPGKE